MGLVEGKLKSRYIAVFSQSVQEIDTQTYNQTGIASDTQLIVLVHYTFSESKTFFRFSKMRSILWQCLETFLVFRTGEVLRASSG